MNKVTLMFPGFRTKAFTMSFDDGINTDIRMASIMKKYGVKGTFNLNSGLFSPEGTVKPEGRDSIPLTVSQAKELFSDPSFEIAAHGSCHHALGHIGGADTTLEAAKFLGMPVVMIDRPQISYPNKAETFDDVLKFITENL